jgi:capsular exopolysaccharide synthesis family protein
MALITFKSPKSAMAEAYRVLCTNLGFTGMERPFHSVLITSALPEDGKSTITSNLAVVTAQAGYKVMLVDCDLRKPIMHKIFQLPNNMGFTNCVLNDMDPEQAAYDLSLSNLKVLTSGPIPPNPAEILNSSRTRAIWNILMSKYDYIFIDSPPLLTVTDASIIAAQVDTSILVVRSGVTRYEIARQAQDQLNNAKSHIIGVVLNQVKPEANYYGYYS